MLDEKNKSLQCLYKAEFMASTSRLFSLSDAGEG
jgi:hypothetical protein